MYNGASTEARGNTSMGVVLTCEMSSISCRGKDVSAFFSELTNTVLPAVVDNGLMMFGIKSAILTF